MPIRSGSYVVLAWLLPAGACQQQDAGAAYAKNAALFNEAKAEAMRFARSKQASLPLDLDLDTLSAPMARHFARTLSLTRQLKLQYLRVATDTTLQYYIAPTEGFISTRYGWFSYPGEVKIRLINEKNIQLPDGWLYTERTVDVAD